MTTHNPRKPRKPRKLPRSQIVTRPTADGMRPHAAHHLAPVLALIEHARARGAAHVEYDLPNRAREAPALRELLVEHLAPLGVGVSAIKRRRGIRGPFVALAWTPPEPIEPGEEKSDERRN